MKKKENIKFAKNLTAIMTVLCFMHGTEAFASEMRLADHGDFTRAVFDFPKLTAYTVEISNSSVKLELGINEKLSVPNKATSLISNTAQTLKNGTLTINFNTTSPTKVKDYRLQRKIVLDIYGDKTPTEATPKQALKSAKIDTKSKINNNLETQQPVAENSKEKSSAPITTKKSDIIKTTPEKLVEEKNTKVAVIQNKPDEELAAKTLEEVQVKLAEYTGVRVESNIKPEKKKKSTGPLDSPPSEPSFLKEVKTPLKGDTKHQMYQETPTKIAISSFKNSKIAVFQRADILWIVTDDPDKNSLPLMEGPLKNFIRKPDVLKSKDALAYAYRLPKKLYPIAKKHGLMWEISLYDNNYIDKEPATISSIFDNKGLCEKATISLEGAGQVITFEDPVIKDTLYVIPTNKDTSIITNSNVNADFKIVPASIGMVIKPFKDSLKLYSINDMVMFTSPNGVDLVNQDFPVLLSSDLETKGIDINDINEQRVFDFPEWIKGGSEKMLANKLKIQDEIENAQAPEEKTSLLIEMAKLYLANAYGHEASGMLDLAQENSPEIAKNPDFIAIRGASEALAGRYQKALEYFSYPPIQQNQEIKLWAGFAAARTEQWKMANRSFPDNNVLLLQYPSTISIPFTIYMAESNLRVGKTKSAQNLLDTVKMNDKAININYKSAIDYLKGEIVRQKGEFTKAVKIWETVSHGVDRLYHTKASLALALLKLNQKEVALDEAINSVENLRFAWREDSLEVEILSTLGKLKAQNLQPLEALEDYASAIKISKKINYDLGYIIESMQKIFYDLFITKSYPATSTFDVISTYNKFSYLFPNDGETYPLIALSFADFLIKADLLEKSAETIQSLLDEKLLNDKKIPEAGAKLGAIHLMNNKPRNAIKAIVLTEPLNSSNMTPETIESRNLLKAKAYSKLGEWQKAVSLLEDVKSQKVKLLKADVLWRAKQWKEAAVALQELIPTDVKELSEENATIVLNAAIAWRLADNYEELKKIKELYEPMMKTTQLNDAFKVITREQNGNNLSDRETTLKIASEVEIFKNFLDSYKNINN